MIRYAAIALSAVLLATPSAQAAAGGQSGAAMTGSPVQYAPSIPDNHSAVVPGVEKPSGDTPSSADIAVGNKNLPESGGSGGPSVGDPVGSGGVTAPTSGNRRGHFALACEVRANGDMVLANIGDETLASGARIRWAARGRLGYFALNADLPAGAHATAADVLEAAKGAPCKASVL